MIPPPPRSTLFPYTTLFRSVPCRVDHRVRLPHAEGRAAVLARDAVLVSRPLDRKSTRLNSSHSQISYAVFCLKKKRGHSESRQSSIGNDGPSGYAADTRSSS